MSWLSFPVALNEVLQYVLRRLIGIIFRVVFVPTDGVTDIRSVSFVSYYVVDSLLFG